MKISAESSIIAAKWVRIDFLLSIHLFHSSVSVRSGKKTRSDLFPLRFLRQGALTAVACRRAHLLSRGTAQPDERPPCRMRPLTFWSMAGGATLVTRGLLILIAGQKRNAVSVELFFGPAADAYIQRNLLLQMEVCKPAVPAFPFYSHGRLAGRECRAALVRPDAPACPRLFQRTVPGAPAGIGNCSHRLFPLLSLCCFYFRGTAETVGGGPGSCLGPMFLFGWTA